MFPVTSQDRILSVLDVAGVVGQFWGYLTALVTWSCTVETLYDGFAIGAVLLLSLSGLKKLLNSLGKYQQLQCLTLYLSHIIDGVSCIFLTVFEVYVPLHVHFLRRIVSEESVWFKKVDSMQFKGVTKLKAIVYACLGLLSCLEPNVAWLAAISGMFLLVLALFCGLIMLRKVIASRSTVSPYSRYESGTEQGSAFSIEQRT